MAVHRGARESMVQSQIPRIQMSKNGGSPQAPPIAWFVSGPPRT